MEDVGIFYGHLVHFMVFCYILWTFGICSLWKFGIFFPVLVFCTKKNLATLLGCAGIYLRIACLLVTLVSNAGVSSLVCLSNILLVTTPEGLTELELGNHLDCDHGADKRWSSL
jgi:hypothetical protein